MVQGKDVFYPQNLFILILDRVMKRVKGSMKGGLPWGMKESLRDLDHADDSCLLAQRFCDMEEKLKRLKEEAELVWIRKTN